VELRPIPSEQDEFWQTTSLADLTTAQWESLCDGCARCCLHKLEDSETRAVYYTNVACRLLDLETGRCTNYAERTRLVPSCVEVSPELLEDPYWLPSSCAYRLLAEGRGLPSWHPLVCGDADAVHRASISVLDKVVSECEAQDWENHLIDWID